ncbi:MAG: lyase family protein, partial [Gemmatimonadales bacterium]
MNRTHRGALLAPVMALGLTWACKPEETPPAAAQTIEDAQGPQAQAAQPVSQGGATRTEKDLLGEKQIPADAYYGVQTARALENFQISGVPINHYPGFIEAWAIVKLAAARGNTDVGAMKKEKLAAIEKAATALRQGKYHDQFQV